MPDGLLLCELHAHTTWSDGYLTLPELVDLYGRSRFDVLCVTDHAVRLDDPSPRAVDSWTWPAYTAALQVEAERALSEYGLLLIRGLELSDNQEDPDHSAHVLALGLETFVSVDTGSSPRWKPQTARAPPLSPPIPIRTATRRRYAQRGESGASARSSET
jgi:hypothetical protein